jgi:alpha-ribazole phosphatase
MSSILLVRHAEPAIHGVFLGAMDPSLSERGQKEALALRGLLPAWPIYASPRKRAQETAHLAFPDAPITTLPGLGERDFGEWEGLYWSEVEKRWPHILNQGHWLEVTPPGGETWTEFMARVAESLAQVRQGPLPAIIFAHLGVNSVLNQLLTGADALQYQQSYAETRLIHV